MRPVALFWTMLIPLISTPAKRSPWISPSLTT